MTVSAMNAAICKDFIILSRSLALQLTIRRHSGAGTCSDMRVHELLGCLAVVLLLSQPAVYWVCLGLP